MYQKQITGNGTFSIMENGQTQSSSVSVHAPAVLTATVVIGYRDFSGTYVPYADGALAAGASFRAKSGYGVDVVANVTGLTAPFHIGTAQEADR